MRQMYAREFRQWFFNRFFSEIHSLSSIRSNDWKEKMNERKCYCWWKLLLFLSKSNHSKTTYALEQKSQQNEQMCIWRREKKRSVPLPFYSPYNKYTTKINRTIPIGTKNIQIYSNASKELFAKFHRIANSITISSKMERKKKETKAQ